MATETEVHATIAGQGLDLEIPASYVGKEGKHFTGFLQPAGLVDGPLEVEPSPSDRWVGQKQDIPVRLKIVDPDRQNTVTDVKVGLQAGWG